MSTISSVRDDSFSEDLLCNILPSLPTIDNNDKREKLSGKKNFYINFLAKKKSHRFKSNIITQKLFKVKEKDNELFSSL